LKKQKSFSEKILQRRAERRRQLWHKIFISLFIVGWLGLVTWSWHKDDVKNKIQLMKASPNWVDFTKFTPVENGRGEQYSVITHDEVTGVPTMVNINSEQWSIVHVKKFNQDNVDGQTFCQNKTIAYLYDANPMDIRDTIIHEIFHAGACSHGGDKWFDCAVVTQSKHKCIYNMADFMTNFALTNKNFMEWYIEE
jgi:hypothetical protein